MIFAMTLGAAQRVARAEIDEPVASLADSGGYEVHRATTEVAPPPPKKQVTRRTKGDGDGASGSNVAGR
jgi:hypothetical protein